MPEKLESFFATRHSKKPKGEDLESKEFPGISERGVELAQERAKEIFKVLEDAEEGTVMFIGGASEAARTKSTAKVFGQEIKRIVAEEGKEDIFVLTKEDIIQKDKGYSQIIEEIAGRIKANPDKKVLVDFPLFLKEFQIRRWLDEEGNFSSYTKALLERNKEDNLACLEDWIGNEGRIGNLEGPNPTKVAEEQLQGIKRLKEFAQKYIGERPLIIGAAGHSWDLDALAIYLANEGKVDLEGLEKVGGEMIKETEPVQVEVTEEKTILRYKGKEFIIESHIEDKKQS